MGHSTFFGVLVGSKRVTTTLTAMDLRCGCGQRLDPSTHNTPDPADRPGCPFCGATSGWQFSVTVGDSVSVRDGVGYKVRRAGRSGKPAVESFDYPAVQRATGQETRHRRTIDREDKRYFEEVEVEATGDILYRKEHHLDLHKGRGDDQGDDTSPRPQTARPEALPRDE